MAVHGSSKSTAHHKQRSEKVPRKKNATHLPAKKKINHKSPSVSTHGINFFRGNSGLELPRNSTSPAEVPPNGSRSVSTRRLHLHFQRHLRMHQSPVPMDLHVRGRENLTPKITRERKITWEQPMGFSQVGFREGTAI